MAPASWVACLTGLAVLACASFGPPPPNGSVVTPPGGADAAAAVTPRRAGSSEEDPAAEALGLEDSGAQGEAAEADSELVEDESPEPSESEAHEGASPAPHPLDGWSTEQISRAVRSDPKLLGSMSIGKPNAGMLFNGEQARASELFELVDPRHAYGTRETLTYLESALRRVHQSFPGSPPLVIGHISAERGGPLSPHLSHQAGRDVDISFYYREPKGWYTRATRQNLDVARTWAFVRALVTETDVEMILIDSSIQALLKQHALDQGENSAWLDSVFKGAPAAPALVRHAPGHATHIHIRFFNPIAEETGRRAHSALLAVRAIPELTSYVKYRARRGDTLKKIAKRYSVSVEAIQKANGLRNSRIREKREYRIPLRGRTPIAPSAARRVPPRRLPPSSALSSRASFEPGLASRAPSPPSDASGRSQL